MINITVEDMLKLICKHCDEQESCDKCSIEDFCSREFTMNPPEAWVFDDELE